MLGLALLQQEVDGPRHDAELLLREERMQANGRGFLSLFRAPEIQHVEHSLSVAVWVILDDLVQVDIGDLQHLSGHLLPITANLASHHHELLLRHHPTAWWEREPRH